MNLIAQFNDGYAKGWKMAVDEWFKEALDIRLTNRMMNGKKKKQWTQGQCYNFQKGDFLTDNKDTKGLIWRDAVKKINIALQVNASSPAAFFKDDDGQKKYSAGNVTFIIFKPDKSKTRLVHTDVANCSQVEFVQILKTGNIPDELIQK